MDYGEFDSDSLALSKRLQAYEKNSNNNLNDYVLSQSAVKGDEFVLELGCGRGKQSLPLSGLMTDGGGCLVSTDISSESASKVSNILDEINPMDIAVVSDAIYQNPLTLGAVSSQKSIAS